MSPTRNRNNRSGASQKRTTRRSKAPNPLRQAGPEGSARTAENMAALKLIKAPRGPNNKYINSLYEAIALNPTLTAPGLFLLNGVGQGTSENTRVGRLTRNKWLDLDLFVESTFAANAIDELRVYIVAESTCLGSALSPAQFFVDNTNFGPTSQRDRTNRNASRYVVLFDSKIFTLGSFPFSSGLSNVAWTGSSPQSKHFSIHLPLNFSTDYSRGNSGTVSDIDTNSLYLLVVTDDTAGGHSQVYGGYTLCFSDDE